MRFVLFVASRYLFSVRKQTFISLISIISMLGVALGVGALIVAIGIMNGFTQELRDKILGVNAHGIIASINGAVFNPDILVREVETVPGVVAATPFIYSEVMISTPAGAKGLILRGVNPASAKKVLGVWGRTLGWRSMSGNISMGGRVKRCPRHPASATTRITAKAKKMRNARVMMLDRRAGKQPASLRVQPGSG